MAQLARIVLILAFLPSLLDAQTTRTEAEADLDLAAILASIESNEERAYNIAPGKCRAFRGDQRKCYVPCHAPYSDACKQILGTDVAIAQRIGLEINTWKGGAGNLDGDGFAPRIESSTGTQRQVRHVRPGDDGKAPTTNHRAAHGWREVAAEAVAVEVR